MHVVYWHALNKNLLPNTIQRAALFKVSCVLILVVSWRFPQVGVWHSTGNDLSATSLVPRINDNYLFVFISLEAFKYTDILPSNTTTPFRSVNLVIHMHYARDCSHPQHVTALKVYLTTSAIWLDPMSKLLCMFTSLFYTQGSLHSQLQTLFWPLYSTK